MQISQVALWDIIHDRRGGLGNGGPVTVTNATPEVFNCRVLLGL